MNFVQRIQIKKIDFLGAGVLGLAVGGCGLE